MPEKETRIIDEKTGGAKGSKIIRPDLIPPQAIEELGRLYGKGAEKYDPWNWRKGYNWSLSIAAMMRHLLQWEKGERFDEETQCHHLASVAWHCMTLMEFQRLGLGTDDRPCAIDASIEYLAGIIDGEGCITIVRTSKGSHELRIDLRMTDEAAVKAFYERWGGNYKGAHNYSNRPDRRLVYRWYISGKKAAEVLTDLYPYLKIKHPQASVGLKFQSLILTRNKGTQKLTEEEISEREELCKQIQSLNH